MRQRKCESVPVANHFADLAFASPRHSIGVQVDLVTREEQVLDSNCRCCLDKRVW
jgi:hypothetical protein